MSIDQNSERLEVEIEFLSIKQEHLMGLNLYWKFFGRNRKTKMI